MVSVGSGVAPVIPSGSLWISLKVARCTTPIASELVALQTAARFRQFVSTAECVVMWNPRLAVQIIQTFQRIGDAWHRPPPLSSRAIWTEHHFPYNPSNCGAPHNEASDGAARNKATLYCFICTLPKGAGCASLPTTSCNLQAEYRYGISTKRRIGFETLL